MELKINTEDISAKDEKILKLILGIKEPSALTHQERVAIVEGGRKMFPKIHGQRNETILQVIDHIEGGTVFDIMKYCEYEEASVRNALAQMKKAKEVETSTTSPKKYFRRGENKDLAFALKECKSKRKSNAKKK